MAAAVKSVDTAPVNGAGDDMSVEVVSVDIWFDVDPSGELPFVLFGIDIDGMGLVGALAGLAVCLILPVGVIISVFPPTLTMISPNCSGVTSRAVSQPRASAVAIFPAPRKPIRGLPLFAMPLVYTKAGHGVNAGLGDAAGPRA